MKPIKIGIIIPSITVGKTFKTVLDIPLVDIFMKSFVNTYNTSNSNINCVFYIGYNGDDPIYSNEESRELIISYIKNLDSKLIINFIQFKEDIEKGHLSRMWNILYDEAYNDNCDYMYQCGDDIWFLTNDWLISAINLLKNNNDIGISGPLCGHLYILTQALFSRKHKDIIGFLVDENIKNWYLDDWYNLLYTPDNVFVDFNHLCENKIESSENNGNYKVVDIKIENLINSINTNKYKIRNYIGNQYNVK